VCYPDKSSGTAIDATKQIGYLMRLELPFFVGILDQERSMLTIYSGEYLPILFSHKGTPKTLILDLHPHHNFGADPYLDVIGDDSFKLKCPVVATLSAASADWMARSKRWNPGAGGRFQPSRRGARARHERGREALRRAPVLAQMGRLEYTRVQS
jgi:hypothetical protein